MTAILDARPLEVPEPARLRPGRGRRERSFALIVVGLLVVLFGILSVPPAEADDDDINTIVGQNEPCGGFDGAVPRGGVLTSNSASNTQLHYNTRAIAVDASGRTLYVADTRRGRVHRISGDTIVSVAGNGEPGFATPDATDPMAANMASMRAIAVGPSGSVYVVNSLSDGLLVQRFTVGSSIETVGEPLPTSATSSAAGLAVDRNGVAYVATGDKLYRVAPNGAVSNLNVAGLQNPEGAAIDGNGNLYISNSGANTVLRVDPSSGAQSVVASGLKRPMGIAVSLQGHRLFVSEYNGGNGGQVKMIRDPASASKVDVVVNASGADSPGVDGVDAVASSLLGPKSVATDASGASLFVLDADACAIRYVRAVPDPVPPSSTPSSVADTGAPTSSTPAGTTPPDGATASEPGPLTAPSAEQGAAPVDEVSPGLSAEPGSSAAGEFDFTSEFLFGGAGTPSDFSSFFSFTPSDFGAFSGSQGFSFSPEPSGPGAAELVAPSQGATNNPAIVAVNAPAPAQPGPVGVSAMPPAAGSPGANAGLVSAGARPADPAARYAMVARDDDEAFPLGLAALGVVMAGSGCVLLVSAGHGRLTPRPRPARARAY